MKRAYTNFMMGFSDKGFNANEVGEDVVAIYKSKSTWTSDGDGEKEVGTPIQIDLSESFELKVCPDGQVPDGYLQLPVKEPYPDEDDFYIQRRNRKFIVAGNPAPFVINKMGGMLDTKLLADGYTSSKDDDIYINGGKFSDTDPLDGEGISIGKVIDTKTLNDNSFAVIALNGGVSDRKYTLAEKVKKINITAPADGSENDTEFIVPENAVVQDIVLKVNTAEATGTTKTISVGIDSTDSGDADGYLAGVDVSGTGLVKGTLANSGQTLGELLTVDEDGAGALVPEKDIASGGKVLTFTAGSADFEELDADIYVYYYDLD
jgi:hypothetical protein